MPSDTASDLTWNELRYLGVNYHQASLQSMLCSHFIVKVMRTDFVVFILTFRLCIQSWKVSRSDYNFSKVIMSADAIVIMSLSLFLSASICVTCYCIIELWEILDLIAFLNETCSWILSMVLNSRLFIISTEDRNLCLTS